MWSLDGRPTTFHNVVGRCMFILNSDRRYAVALMVAATIVGTSFGFNFDPIAGSVVMTTAIFFTPPVASEVNCHKHQEKSVFLRQLFLNELVSVS